MCSLHTPGNSSKTTTSATPSSTADTVTPTSKPGAAASVGVSKAGLAIMMLLGVGAAFGLGC
jgi:hypothetical protein